MLASVAALVLGAPAAVTASPEASAPAAAAPAEVVRKVTYEGRTLTVRMHRVRTRGPEFEVLVQRADGELVRRTAPAERSYLGSVDRVPGALAAGIIRSDGKFEGLVVFDRGGTWQFVDRKVVSTRGLDQPTAYKWPSSTDASRNVTVAPRQVGGTTRRWDVGYDLANRWFKDRATINKSVVKALDAAELNTTMMLAAYETNARMRPATGRVVIRASATAEPYVGYDDLLGKAKDEWEADQSDAGVEAIALWHGAGEGGGVAWLGTIASGMSVSSNGGTGAPWVVTRHEIGHNWGISDNHTNGPEGATINSGNAFHRFDGTELSALLRLRNDRLAEATSPFPAVARLREPVPPYAALDLLKHQTSGVPYSFRPTANDHDANGGKLSLKRVGPRSRLGGVVRNAGNVVTYIPPKVSKRTVDWLRYVVRDPSGKTATGVALFRVDPHVAPGAVSTWPKAPVTSGKGYTLLNAQSRLRAGKNRAGDPVQRSAAGGLTTFTLSALEKGVSLRSTAGRCLSTLAKGQVEFRPCRSVASQRFKVVRHPTVGVVLVSRAHGTCLTPKGGSILEGTPLRHQRCGLRLAQSWELRKPATTG